MDHSSRKLVPVWIFGLVTSLLANVLGLVLLSRAYGRSSVHTALPIRLAPKPMIVQAAGHDGFGLHNNSAWASYFTNGHGFVRLSDGTWWSVAMHHQLHCLNRMRQIFVDLHNRTTTPHDDEHMEHCLSYLRQMILCEADHTLEPAIEIVLADGSRTHASWAEDSVHKCRGDWRVIAAWVDENFESWRDKAGSYSSEPGVIVGP